MSQKPIEVTVLSLRKFLASIRGRLRSAAGITKEHAIVTNLRPKVVKACERIEDLLSCNDIFDNVLMPECIEQLKANAAETNMFLDDLDYLLGDVIEAMMNIRRNAKLFDNIIKELTKIKFDANHEFFIPKSHVQEALKACFNVTEH